MKRKIKLLPSVLLLVLCLGVLGVGIYAARPASNTITGTIEINAAGGEIEVSVYKNNVQQGTTQTTRTGVSINFGEITFDPSSASKPSDVSNQTVKVRIQNNSSYDMAGYFWNKGNATTPPVGVPTSSDVMTTSTIKDSNNTTVITATYGFGEVIASGEYQDFMVNLSLTNLSEEQINQAPLNIYLVVYKYTSVTATNVSMVGATGFPDSPNDVKTAYYSVSAGAFVSGSSSSTTIANPTFTIQTDPINATIEGYKCRLNEYNAGALHTPEYLWDKVFQTSDYFHPVLNNGVYTINAVGNSFVVGSYYAFVIFSEEYGWYGNSTASGLDLAPDPGFAFCIKVVA